MVSGFRGVVGKSFSFRGNDVLILAKIFFAITSLVRCVYRSIRYSSWVCRGRLVKRLVSHTDGDGWALTNIGSGYR